MRIIRHARLAIALATMLVAAAGAVAPQPAAVVAPDGAGGAFRSVQAAIDSLPDNDGLDHLIVIRPGVYRERVNIPASKRQVTMRGADADAAKTTITCDVNALFVPQGTTQPVGTGGSATFVVAADNFTAERITFANTAGDNGQAVAVKALGDRAVFRDCRFLGWQDTLYADAGRQYYVNCHIEGRVDFIFGGATAVFDRCTIHSKNGGYITAARTLPDQPIGYVFLDCTLTGEGAPAYLGRPWQWDRGRIAYVAFIRTRMGPHIRPEGWNQWDRPGNPNTQPARTARYFEFASADLSGNPVDLSKRVGWSRQLTPEQAEALTAARCLAGDDGWNPQAPASTAGQSP